MRHISRHQKEEFIAAAVNSATDECIEWPWGRTPQGYPTISEKGATIYVHRMVCAITHGAPEVGQVARHTCDNPPCINSHHLVWGTKGDNVRDSYEHGRARRGSARPEAKLTEEQVSTIRSRAAAGEKPKDLAAEYGIDRSTVSLIVNRKMWRHIP